jgi:hypothetical protein
VKRDEEERARCVWARDLAAEWWVESVVSLLSGDVIRAAGGAERARYLEHLALGRLP